VRIPKYQQEKKTAKKKKQPQSHLLAFKLVVGRYYASFASSTMKLTTFTACMLALLPMSAVTAYPITGDVVNCRSGPGTSYPTKKTYKKGQNVSITCQAHGTNVNGNSIWDKTSDGCYVSDVYVRTGSDGYVTTKCSSGGSPPPSAGKIPGPVTDDYPYKNSCGPIDKWNYFRCQCTSFVAWRINERLGIHFHNQYKGTNWGNANSWDEAARSTGVRVDSNPVPGCVAQTNEGWAGHVAWVTAVSGNQVTIEEYNYARERYGTRKVAKSAFNYIHLKV
jgi:surface antigen